MSQAQAIKLIVRVASAVLGIYGILILVISASIFWGPTEVGISDLYFLLPYAAISAVLFWNAILVFRNWSEKAIGLFSAIVSVLCASILANYYSEFLDGALERGATLVVSGIAFGATALLSALFLILKVGLIKPNCCINSAHLLAMQPAPVRSGYATTRPGSLDWHSWSASASHSGGSIGQHVG